MSDTLGVTGPAVQNHSSRLPRHPTGSLLGRILQGYRAIHSLHRGTALQQQGWWYEDENHQEFGPFRSSQMRAWLLDGYFSLSQRVRFGAKAGPDDGRPQFVEIKSLYPADCHGGRNPKNSKMLFELDLGADLMAVRDNLLTKLAAIDLA